MLNDGITCGMLSNITTFLETEKPQRHHEFPYVCATEANLRIVGDMTKSATLLVA